MNDVSSQQQGSRPATRDGARAFVVTPFHRLARTHAATTMADAMVAAALADSLFFSLPADTARTPVVRYLLITMLPFAVLSPLVGPLIDRLKGGHRFVLIGTAAARALLCFLMIDEIAAGGTSFFLLALCVLVSQRAYHVARSALVPTVVTSDAELVEANSKLAIISGLSGFVGILPAAVLIRLFGPGWALGLAIVTYLIAVGLGTRIPAARVANEPAGATERHELRGAGIVLAGSAMGLLRMCVGFLTLLIAFDFRGGDRRPWEFAVVAGVGVASQLIGAATAPRLRVHTSEENMLTGALGLVVVGASLSLLLGEVLGASILGACVGFAAGTGKMAFDSILQRDAPDANRGRSFARFETRFQITYVVGAFIPVAVVMGAKTGFALILVVALFATASYVVGRLAWAHRSGTHQTTATAVAVGIDDRFTVVSGEVKSRLVAAPRSVLIRFRGGHGAAAATASSTASSEDPDGPGEGAAGAPVDEVTVVVDITTGPAPPDDLAGGSPTAWQPPQREFPWEVNPEGPTTPGSYLDDVDPSVSNPFPWAPPPDDDPQP